MGLLRLPWAPGNTEHPCGETKPSSGLRASVSPSVHGGGEGTCFKAFGPEQGPPAHSFFGWTPFPGTPPAGRWLMAPCAGCLVPACPLAWLPRRPRGYLRGVAGSSAEAGQALVTEPSSQDRCGAWTGHNPLSWAPWGGPWGGPGWPLSL